MKKIKYRLCQIKKSTRKLLQKIKKKVDIRKTYYERKKNNILQRSYLHIEFHLLEE